MNEQGKMPRKWTCYKMVAQKKPTYFIFVGASAGETYGIQMQLREGSWKMERDCKPLDMVRRQQEIGRINVAHLVSQAIKFEEMSYKNGRR